MSPDFRSLPVGSPNSGESGYTKVCHGVAGQAWPQPSIAQSTPAQLVFWGHAHARTCNDLTNRVSMFSMSRLSTVGLAAEAAAYCFFVAVADDVNGSETSAASQLSLRVHRFAVATFALEATVGYRWADENACGWAT